MRDDLAEALVQVVSEGFARLSEDVQALTRAMEQAKMVDRAVIEKLRAAVERNSTVQGSAVALIQGLVQSVRDLATKAEDGDQEQVVTDLNSLADQLESQATALSDAVMTNTPAQA